MWFVAFLFNPAKISEEIKNIKNGNDNSTIKEIMNIWRARENFNIKSYKKVQGENMEEKIQDFFLPKLNLYCRILLTY